MMDSVVLVLISTYVLFIPGFTLSYVFFKPDDIDKTERLALSFALSVGVLPLAMFYLYTIGVAITKFSVAYTVFYLCILSLAVIYLRYNFSIWKRKK